MCNALAKQLENKNKYIQYAIHAGIIIYKRYCTHMQCLDMHNILLLKMIFIYFHVISFSLLHISSLHLTYSSKSSCIQVFNFFFLWLQWRFHFLPKSTNVQFFSNFCCCYFISWFVSETYFLFSMHKLTLPRIKSQTIQVKSWNVI